MSEIITNEAEGKKNLNFIEAMVEKDLAEGKNNPFPARTERILAYRSCQSDLPGLRNCRTPWRDL